MTIFLDTETTGLTPHDEIVEIAIIDDESVLLNTLIKPRLHETWDQAQKIHGISPKDVRHFPSIESYVHVIREILDGQHLVIYNSAYDMQYLGFAADKPFQICCAMEAFQRHYGSSRWQKLDFAAEYCGYKFDGPAHRALADARAARAVWRYLQREAKKG